jgi:hypothetical protein
MLSLLINIALAGALAGAIAVGIKRLFPKRGDWLPVMCSAFVPPIIIASYAVFRSLVALGAMAERAGTEPPGPISFFLDSVSIYIFFSVTWLIVGVPAAFAALHLFRQK